MATKAKAKTDRAMITFVVPTTELEILKEYCSTYDVSQTSVLREAIRSLESRLSRADS